MSGGVRANWVELVAVIAVTTLAAVLRMYKLLDYPPGFHGDEGLSGFDAQLILDHGWVGPYLKSSHGYPAGYAYWTALVVKFVGNDAWGVRFAPALLGTLTIPLSYVAFRIMFGFRVAILACIFMATSAWHLLYSRVAFLSVAWPIIEVATMIPLFLAVRTKRWYFYLAAGACAGAGIYGYGSYPIFLVALGLFLPWVWLRAYGPSHAIAFIRHMGVFALGFYLVALSMIQYVRSPENNYFVRIRSLSITKTPRWQEADRIEQLHIVWQGTRDWVEKMVWRGVPDYIDAAGYGAMLDRYSVALAAAGIVLLFLGWRRLQNVFSLLVLFIVPFGAIMTVDGAYRRSLGILPVLMVAMALPLAKIWEWADKRPLIVRAIATTAIACIVTIVAVTNVRYFFQTLTQSPSAQFAYVEDLAAASQYIARENPDYVYFLAYRWTYTYDTRGFLAPGVAGEDRSIEFTPDHEMNLTGADRTQDVMFMLIGGYIGQLPELQLLYPEGRPYNGIADDGRLLFVAFNIPRHPDAMILGVSAPASEAP